MQQLIELIPLHDPAKMAVLILGLAGSISLLISALATHKNRVLGASLFTSTFFIIQSFILGTPATAVASMVGMTRNGMALGSTARPWLNHWGFAPLFIVAHVTVFITLNDFTHFEWYQALPLSSGILAVIAPYFSVLTMKIIFSVISGSWLTYEFINGMHTQMIGETLFFTLNAVAIFVLFRAKANGVTDVPDLDTAVIHAITNNIPVQEVISTMTGAIHRPAINQDAPTDTKPIPVASEALPGAPRG